MEIKYYVRTTQERVIDYNLDYTLILNRSHKPVQSFIEALYQIADSDAVLLEDDLVLCDNFKEEIEKVIAQYPDYIINFFTEPFRYFTTHKTEFFSYNQCTYYPKGVTKILADEMTKLLDKYKTKSWNLVEHRALINLGIVHYVYRPSLVQHKDVKSILNNGAQLNRSTIYFKDYLDKLGITLEEAYKVENREKLQEMLNEDIKQWEKEMKI